MDGVPDYIYSKDLSGRFVRVNRAFASSHGYADATQIIGTTDFDYFEKSLAEEFRESEQRIMKTGSRSSTSRSATFSAMAARGGSRPTKCCCPHAATSSASWESRETSPIIAARKADARRQDASPPSHCGIARNEHAPRSAWAGRFELGALVAEYKAAADDPGITAEDHRAIGKEMPVR